MRVRLLFTGALIVAGILVAGCATTAQRPTPPASTRTGVGSYSADANGSVEATGYVGRSDLEGGFWALYDRPLGPSSAIQPKVLAVLLPGSVDEGGIAALDGSFVRVGGRVSGGASVRMAGPEVFVDSIDVITSDTPQ